MTSIGEPLQFAHREAEPARHIGGVGQRCETERHLGRRRFIEDLAAVLDDHRPECPADGLRLGPFGEPLEQQAEQGRGRGRRRRGRQHVAQRMDRPPRIHLEPVDEQVERPCRDPDPRAEATQIVRTCGVGGVALIGRVGGHEADARRRGDQNSRLRRRVARGACLPASDADTNCEMHPGVAPETGSVNPLSPRPPRIPSC